MLKYKKIKKYNLKLLFHQTGKIIIGHLRLPLNGYDWDTFYLYTNKIKILEFVEHIEFRMNKND